MTRVWATSDVVSIETRRLGRMQDDPHTRREICAWWADSGGCLARRGVRERQGTLQERLQPRGYLVPFHAVMICQEANCIRYVVAKGRCDMHYRQFRRTMVPPCSVEACPRGVHAKGLCVSHYYAERQAIKPKCSRASCERVEYCRGLCSLHYNRQRGGQDMDRPPQRQKSVQSKYREDGARFCSGCDRYLDTARFSTQSASSDGLNAWCTKCNTLTRFGINAKDYEEMSASQAGACAICGRSDIVLAVDHDHACCAGRKSCGNCIRGLLCGNCNRALGLLREDPSLFMSAVLYLKKDLKPGA